MIRLANGEDQAAVVAALRSGNPAAQTESAFWVGNKRYDDRADTLRYGREGDSLAVGLESDVFGPLSPSLKNQDAAVDVIVAGIPIRRFTGRVHKPVTTGPVGTLRANTGGWWADGETSVKVGRERFFAGYTPERAAEEMLFKLPYSGAVEVEDTPQKEFKRGNVESFPRTDPVKAVLDAVTDETKLVFADTRLNGCRGRIPRPAPLLGEVAWTFVVGRDCDVADFTYSPPVAEYFDVLAWRVSAEPGSSGSVEVLAYAEIPGSEAPEDATFLIPIETEGPEGYAEAAAKVSEAVTNLVHGQSEWSLNLKWIHALLEEGDAVEVLEPVEDEEHDVLRRWLGRVDLINEDAGEITQGLSGRATHREARVLRPETFSFAENGGVLAYPVDPPAPPVVEPVAPSAAATWDDPRTFEELALTFEEA